MGTYAPTGPGNCPLLEAKRQIINNPLLACVRSKVSICQKLESIPEGGTISTLQEGRFGREVWSFRVVCLFYVPSHFECASIFLNTTRSLSRTRFQYRTLLNLSDATSYDMQLNCIYQKRTRKNSVNHFEMTDTIFIEAAATYCCHDPKVLGHDRMMVIDSPLNRPAIYSALHPG